MCRSTAWIVSVHTEYEQPQVFGPYTERQAGHVAAQLNQEVELSTGAKTGNRHPFVMQGAYAHPLHRYEDFLEDETRSRLRREVEDAERQWHIDNG